MGRAAVSTFDQSAWLADLITTAEVMAAAAKPCDPAIVKAFIWRLGAAQVERPRRDHP